MEMLKTLFYSLFFCLAFLFCGFVSANDLNDEQREQVEQSMTNTTNQFIYAFFGKELLVSFATSDDKAALANAPIQLLDELSSPFNSLTGLFVRGAIDIIYYATVSYFLLRTLAFILDATFLYAKNSKSILSKTDLFILSLRFTFIFALVAVPVSLNDENEGENTNSSMYVFGLFKAVGAAADLADDSFANMLLSQKSSLATIKMPAADAKVETGLAANAFYTCTRLDTTRQGQGIASDFTAEVPIHFDPNLDIYRGVLNVGECSLEFRASLDKSMGERAVRINKQLETSLLDEGIYYDAQVYSITQSINRLLDDAKRYSLVLAAPYATDTESWQIKPQLKSTEFQLFNYSSHALSNDELNNWEQFCSVGFFDGINDAGLTDNDKVRLNFLSARCHSYFLTDSVLFPDYYGDLDTFLSTNPLKNNALPLCIDNISAVVDGYSAEYKSQFDDPSKKFRADKQIALESCLTSLCSEASIKSGGAYGCMASMGVFEDRFQDHQVKDKGIFMAGLHMYSLFSNKSPTPMAKKIFTGLSLSFHQDELSAPIGSSEFSIKVPVPALAISTYSTNDTNEHVIPLLTGTLNNPILSQFLAPPNEKSFIEYIEYSRLLTCAKSPLQVAGGYVCGNLPEEMSHFGINVLKFAIFARTVLLTGDAIFKRGKPVAEGGLISSGYANNFALKSASLIGQGVLGATIIESVTGGSLNVTDEFGFMNTAEIQSLWLGSDWMMMLVGLSAFGGSIILTFFEGLLYFALLIGIVFGFLVPLFPMILMLNAFSKFVYIFLKSITFTGFFLVDAFFDFDNDNEIINNRMESVVLEWFAVVLKLPLTFVGALLAWLVSNVVIAHMIARLDQLILLERSYTLSLSHILGSSVMFFVSFAIVFVIYNYTMSLIESFYDFTVEWLIGSMNSSPYSDRKVIGWRDTRDVLRVIGRS
jgi:hypothetical protein